MLRVALVPFLAATLLSPTCGGSSSSTSPPLDNLTNNVQLISVDPGPADEYFDGAFTSVTVCVPGSSTCQTISGILVDTGSSGLRILSSALTVPLPQQTASNGSSIVECNQFEDGYTWGPVQTADVAMSGEQARSVPIQVIDSAGSLAIPSSCSSSGPSCCTMKGWRDFPRCQSPESGPTAPVRQTWRRRLSAPGPTCSRPRTDCTRRSTNRSRRSAAAAARSARTRESAIRSIPCRRGCR